MSDGFGRLARVYEGLERLVYSDLLVRARLALLGELAQAKRVLVLGEGDGRFLLALLKGQQRCGVTVLEHSPGMIKRAQTRVEKEAPEALSRVTFQSADTLHVRLPARSYDVIVTNFLLDVFGKPQRPRVIQKLSAALEPGGLWLLSDFAAPRVMQAGIASTATCSCP